MSLCMTDVTPQVAEDPTSQTRPPAPRVKVIVMHTPGADLDAALATVRRQVYEGVATVEVVGEPDVEKPEDVVLRANVAAAIAQSGPEIDYLWLVHSDARPRPDALSALVSEVERANASLGGSKVLVAGTKGELESIGSATDVFGTPFSGLDDGEIDLQQYDVVREVAFVSSVSMLVRRDLAQGLGGVDTNLRPGAAGQDFSQRVRLAGGRVVIVPSSEVFHQGRCGATPGWRDQAGRYRAMLKAYRLVTLAWVIPFGLMVGLIDSIANLIFLRWRPLVRFVAATGWNLAYLPSTLLARRRFRKVRAVGDEELFRFQARGSIRLRELGTDLGDRLLFMFDEDHALVRSTRRIWSSPGIWGALLAGIIAFLSARSFFFVGVPNTGFSLPFEAPTVALSRFLGGWNEAGLGSAAAVHPSVGLTGLLSLIWFGHEGAARTLITLGFALMGVVGMGRLAGRLGFRGPGRYLAGLVLLAGPGTALAAGSGSWLAIGGAAILPWSIRSLYVPGADVEKGLLGRLGWAVLWSLLLAAFSPALVVVPLVFAGVSAALGWKRASLPLVAASLLGVVAAAGFLMDDPGWILDDQRRFGLGVSVLWPVLLMVATVPPLLMPGKTGRLVFMGALLSLAGIFGANAGLAGPGVEEAALILASFGAALLVAIVLDAFGRTPMQVLATLSAIAMLLLSMGTLGDGRLGLPAGDDNARFAFASTLAGEGGPGRILLISEIRSEIPGEARRGPGFWYRTLDGIGSTLDEAWLPPPGPGDEKLDIALSRIATGAELRPGTLLAEFSVDWVDISGGPSQLERTLASQLDLTPIPLDPGSSVFENPAALPLVTDGMEIWGRDGTGFAGDATADRVRISMNYDPDWHPASGPADWATTVSAETGWARYRPTGLNRVLPLVAAGLLLASLVVIVVGRTRQ